MIIFLLIVYIVLAVFAIVLLSKLEKTFNEALKDIYKNFDLLNAKYKNLYNCQKGIEYRISKLETAMNKNRNQKRK